MNITVVGLGKIGLPLAVQYATKGHQVVGLDISPTVVATVAAGAEPFPGETDLGRLLSESVGSGRMSATTNYANAMSDAEVVVVVVPLFVDAAGAPDFDWMDAATSELSRHLRPATLICYETTLPVGTTRQRWKPMIEQISGFSEGLDFYLAFSPERVLTGRVFSDLRRYPKLVGGLSPAGAALAVDFYERVLDFDDRPDLQRGNGVWDLGSAEAAELAKLAETTYRDVNIGLANQFARFADEAHVDITNVIDAANSQPFSHIHKPGIAVGGHCIPVYPRLYLWNDPSASVVRAAREANEAMPEYAVSLLAAAHGDLASQHVVVLGASYRGGVKETAFSGVFATVRALEARGAIVSVHDPLYDAAELRALGFNPHSLGDPADAVVVQSDHDEYRTVTPADFPGVRSLIDGRRIIDPASWSNVARRTIGGGDSAPPG